MSWMFSASFVVFATANTRPSGATVADKWSSDAAPDASAGRVSVVHDPAAYEPADCEIDKAARPEPSLPVARSTTDVPVATRDTTPVGNRDQPVTTSCAVPHVAPLSVDR